MRLPCNEFEVQVEVAPEKQVMEKVIQVTYLRNKHRCFQAGTKPTQNRDNDVQN